MWNSNHHYTLLQQGAGNLEVESEESHFSKESEVPSQETRSSQEETENLQPWSAFLMKSRNAMRPSSTH